MTQELNTVNNYVELVQQLKEMNATPILNPDQYAVQLNGTGHTSCFQTMDEIQAFIEGIMVMSIDVEKQQ